MLIIVGVKLNNRVKMNFFSGLFFKKVYALMDKKTAVIKTKDAQDKADDKWFNTRVCPFMTNLIWKNKSDGNFYSLIPQVYVYRMGKRSSDPRGEFKCYDIKDWTRFANKHKFKIDKYDFKLHLDWSEIESVSKITKLKRKLINRTLSHYGQIDKPNECKQKIEEAIKNGKFKAVCEICKDETFEEFLKLGYRLNYVSLQNIYEYKQLKKLPPSCTLGNVRVVVHLRKKIETTFQKAFNDSYYGKYKKIYKLWG